MKESTRKKMRKTTTLKPQYRRKDSVNHLENTPPAVLSPEMWEQILGGLPSPNGVSIEEIMAHRVLVSLDGYRDLPHFRGLDAKTLANAMVAYGRMMHDHKLRP